MRCKDCRFELGTSLQAGRGVLAPEVADHAADCPECDVFASDCAATSRAAGSLSELTTSPDFAARLRRKLAESASVPDRRAGWLDAWRTPVLPARQAYVAAGLLVVLIAVLGVAIHSMIPAAGLGGPGLAAQQARTVDGSPPAAVGTSAPATGAMPATFVEPMRQQHRAQEITSPGPRDAGYYMVSPE